jgi:molecular chaperone HscB
MNYYELFEIPPQLLVDTVALKKKYYQLSMQYHPDRIEQGQQNITVLEQAATLNKAWTCFLDKEATLAYYLKEQNLLSEGDKFALDKGFLMEVMDWNEALVEAKLESNTQDAVIISDKIQAKLSAIDEAIITLNKVLLEQPLNEVQHNSLVNFYYQKKYLQRLLANN